MYGLNLGARKGPFAAAAAALHCALLVVAVWMLPAAAAAVCAAANEMPTPAAGPFVVAASVGLADRLLAACWCRSLPLGSALPVVALESGCFAAIDFPPATFDAICSAAWQALSCG